MNIITKIKEYFKRLEEEAVQEYLDDLFSDGLCGIMPIYQGNEDD